MISIKKERNPDPQVNMEIPHQKHIYIYIYKQRSLVKVYEVLLYDALILHLILFFFLPLFIKVILFYFIIFLLLLRSSC